MLLGVLVCCALSLTTSAQDGILDVYGTVKDDATMKKMEGAVIKVLQNASEYDTFTTAGNGKYEFELPLGYSYKLSFSKGDYISKSVEINTKGIPEEDMAGGFQLNMDMSLFNDDGCFDPAVLNKPIGKAAFDPVRNAVEFDFDYTAGVQREIEAEFARCEELEEKMDEMLEEFAELIAKGDEKMGKEAYADAVDLFQQALDIFPDKEPAPEKLEAAKKALAEQEAAAELERRYAELLDNARADIKKEQFEDARDALNEALTLKPDEREPKDMLAEIADKLAEIEKRQQYEGIIARADDLFKKESFEDAVAEYESALDLFPAEKYPSEQISEARRIMEERAAQAEAEAEIEAEYQRLMDLGDNNIQGENYDAAIRNFEEAAKVKPDEQEPEKKIEEVRRLIREREDRLAREAEQAADAEAAAIDRAYDDKVREADDLFSAEALDEAKRTYQEALKIKPDEKYPKSRIDKIEELKVALAQKREAEADNDAAAAEAARLDREYEDKVREADEHFSAEALEDAKSSYQEALKLKPQEKYPKSRIQRIDEMIAELAAQAEAERLAQLENEQDAERLAREEEERLERERQREEERRRREEEERRRREEEAARREQESEEERIRNENFANNANASTEDEAERYYREARVSEERAKTKAIEARKDKQQDFLSDKEADARDRADQQVEQSEQISAELERIYRDGDRQREERTRQVDREKDKVNDRQGDYASRADEIRAAYIEDVDDKEEALASLSDGDVHRQGRVQNVEVRKEVIRESQRDYVAKGTSLRSANDFEVKRSKERQLDMQAEGENVRLDNVERTDEVKERRIKFEEDLQQAAQEMKAINSADIENKKEQLREIGEGKEELRQENEEKVDGQKEQAADLNRDRSRDARIRTEDKRDELFDKYRGAEKDPKDYILPEGAEDLEEGVQERSYEEGNKMVIERIVKRDNKVDTYRKVISKTGIYYFKNNRSITEITWKRETLEVTD